ncbi:hypothetical protein [Chondromyces apiculatus]|uniref:Collagen triple helix repeat domain protein n=1 Tax=Chondromyces apiculatus DSM 436 TaxID=1192034 RepID=A0A017SUZ4_9BACT|nr:hypothetical protein [Chondromyces apiculatus]EYF00435.1 Hypothetical protein CAP_0842 [Chondromyces apiculatus DSM 436]
MRAGIDLRALLVGATVLHACLGLGCSRGASSTASTAEAQPAAGEAHGLGSPEPGVTRSPGTEAEALAAAFPAGSRIERDGLAIGVAMRPFTAEQGASDGGKGVVGGMVTAGSDVTVELTITDAATGAPVRGLSPLGWMSRRDAGAPGAAEGPLAEPDCRGKIKSYMAGLLSVRPEVDLNDYLLWTLNEDSSLSVIDPHVAFSRTKLRSVVSLGSPGVAFALHPSNDSLYVTLGGGRGVAVVDTRRAMVRRNVAVGEDPTAIVVAPGGHTVWVGNDGDGTVSVLDARSGDVLKTLPVGPGHHELAFSGGGGTAWITSRGGASVAVVDALALEPLGEVTVGEGAVSLAASDDSGVVHVVLGGKGEVVMVDAARREVTGRVPLGPGLGAVRFDPRGRFSFVLNPVAGQVHILDAATGKVAHQLSGFAAPDAVTFTEAYAYVRQAGAAKVSLIDRAALGGSVAPPVVDVQAGQKAPSMASGGAAPFAMAPIAEAPDGKSVLIANPADKALYFYAEGMMVPAGTFPGYGREPRAVLIEDRSLDEVRPGVYATTARLGADGRYDVEFLLDRPRMAVCLEASVAPAPADDDAAGCAGPGCAGGPALSLDPLFDADLWLEAGVPATLRFRATAKGGPALDAKEMEIMIVRFPVGYRWSGAPRDEGDGTFSVTFTPPTPGEYRMLPSAVTRSAPPGSLPYVPLRVFGAEHASFRAGGR